MRQGVINDWICECGHVERNVVLPSGEAPFHCGVPMLTCWDHGHPPATDVHEPTFYDATGKWHSSNRDADACLQEQAKVWSERNGMQWNPMQAGDAEGGCRIDNRSKGLIASYKGQGSRRSRGELAEGKTVDAEPSRAEVPRRPSLAEYEVNGYRPRRMSADEAKEARRKPIHA